MIPPVSSNAAERSRWLALLLGLLAMLGLWCWLEVRALSSQRDSHAALLAQVAQMNADVAEILSLRTAPRLATERERPNDELLEEIRVATERAGIASDHWIRNDPSPPVRIPRSPYKRLHTRLSFENVDLRQFVEFLYYLLDADRTLTRGPCTV